MIVPGSISWGADTVISMPEPMARGALVEMGGFCMTMRGISHNFTETDREIFLTPTFSPDVHGVAGEVPE